MSKSCKTLKLPKDKYRWNEKKGYYEIHMSLLVDDPDNPRDKNDMKTDAPSLKNLINSILAEEFGGVHLPISGHVKNNKLHIIEGHRRVAACKEIISKLQKQAKISGEEPDVEKYEWVPVSVTHPDSRISELVQMMTSNSLKRDWSFKEEVKFSKKLFKEFKDSDLGSLENDEDLAHSIGWNIDRYKVMLAISESTVLYKASQEYVTCTYKGWRHAVQIQNLLNTQRTELMEELTGVSSSKKKTFQEAIYKLIVNKIDYYANSRGKYRDKKRQAQPGSLLERCLPPLRNLDIPDSHVKAWLTKDIDLTPRSVERMTESSSRKREIAQFVEEIDGCKGKQTLVNKLYPVSKKLTKPVKRSVKPSLKPKSKAEVSYAIEVPKAKTKVFSQVIDQFEDIVTDLGDKFTAQEKTLLQSALALLKTGYSKKKSA